MAIQGLRDVSNFTTNQRPQNWREGIMLLAPNGTAPLFALTSVMKTKVTDDPQFNWFDKIQPSQRVQMNSTLATGDTTISLATGGSQLKDGHLLYVELTGEVMLVNGDPSSETSITVVRGYSGTTTSTSITATGAGINPYLTVIGSAYEEGSDAPTGINYDPTDRYNYTQIFRNTLELTRTASKTRLRTGDAVKEARREALELHMMEIERAMWFGQRNSTVKNGEPLRTMRGVLNWIDSGNITDNAGTAVSLSTLEGWLRDAFSWGSSEKVGFCGNVAMMAIQQVIRRNSTYNLEQGQKEFGMNVSRLVTPFGHLILKTPPLWNRMTGGTTGTGTYYGVNSWLAILDMQELVYRPFQGDDTRWEPKLEANGMDGKKSGFITEAGLEVHHPTAHTLIKGIASAAADS